MARELPRRGVKNAAKPRSEVGRVKWGLGKAGLVNETQGGLPHRLQQQLRLTGGDAEEDGSKSEIGAGGRYGITPVFARSSR